jgi:hypothetical protein
MGADTIDGGRVWGELQPAALETATTQVHAKIRANP